MEKNFPKKVLILKVGERVICTNAEKANLFLQVGTVKFAGVPKGEKTHQFGVEFDKPLKLPDVKAFASKSGHGAMLALSELRKLVTEKFDVGAYKNALLAERGGAPAAPRRGETVVLEGEEEGDEEHTEASHHVEKNHAEKTHVAEKDHTPEKTHAAEKSPPPAAKPAEKPAEKAAVLPPASAKADEHASVGSRIEADDKYIENRQLTLQVAELKSRNAALAEQAARAASELRQVQENYEALKSMSDSNHSAQIASVEEVGALKLRVSSAASENEALRKRLEEFKDYGEFQKKFEKLSIESTAAKEELAQLRQNARALEEKLREQREQLELYELEGEVAVRTDGLPVTPEELKKNYALIQRAFNKLDLDFQIQREEFEIRLEEQQREMQKVRENFRNALGSDEVKSIIGAKDKQIAQLHELVDQYALANKTVESMTEKLQKKELEAEAAKDHREKLLEKIKTLEEEAALLDEINKELTGMYDERSLKVEEMKLALGQREEEKKELGERLQKYKAKLEEVSEEKDLLALQSAKPDESGKISELMLDLTKTVGQRQAKLREKFALKLKARMYYWDCLKWHLMYEGIPEKMVATAAIAEYDRFRDVCLQNDKIEIIAENIFENFIMNEAMGVENQNLVLFTRSLLQTLLELEDYFGLLRHRLVHAGSPAEVQTLMSGTLWSELAKCHARVDELYELFRKNEVVPNYAYSELSEALVKLRAETPESDARLALKHALNTALVKLADLLVNERPDPQQKQLVNAVLPKLIMIWEQVAESRADEKAATRAQQLADALPASLAELRGWVESAYREWEGSLLGEEALKESLRGGPWAASLRELNAKLASFEGVNETLAAKEAALARVEAEKAEKVAELDKANVARLNMESKMLKHQGLVNQASMLEMENEELKKVSKKQALEIENLSKAAKTAEQESSQVRSEEVSRKNTMDRFRTSMRMATRGSVLLGAFAGKPEEVKTEYKSTVKFEINSLNAILSSTLSELNAFRAQNHMRRLQQVTAHTTHLTDLTRIEQRQLMLDRSVAEFVGALKQNRAQLKREIAQLKVLDLRQPLALPAEVKTYHDSLQRREGLLWNSKKSVAKLSEFDEEMYLGYDIDINKEFGAREESSPALVYAKLSLSDAKPDFRAPPPANVVTASLLVK